MQVNIKIINTWKDRKACHIKKKSPNSIPNSKYSIIKKTQESKGLGTKLEISYPLPHFLSNQKKAKESYCLEKEKYERERERIKPWEIWSWPTTKTIRKHIGTIVNDLVVCTQWLRSKSRYHACLFVLVPRKIKDGNYNAKAQCIALGFS